MVILKVQIIEGPEEDIGSTGIEHVKSPRAALGLWIYSRLYPSGKDQADSLSTSRSSGLVKEPSRRLWRETHLS